MRMDCCSLCRSGVVVARSCTVSEDVEIEQDLGESVVVNGRGRCLGGLRVEARAMESLLKYKLISLPGVSPQL